MQPEIPPAAAEQENLERYDRYYLKAPDGSIRFNTSGRTRLGPWFAQHGYSLLACKTEGEFHGALRSILAAEIADARAQLAELLNSPDIRADERAALERLLGCPKP